MPETIKISAFIPGHTSEKSGKFVPPKIKDGNDREFAVPKELVDFVSLHQGQTVEVEFTEKVNGQWTNRNLIAAKLPPPPAEKAAGNGGWRRDPAESSLILRQVALKAAVELAASVGAVTMDGVPRILMVAEQFNDWLHERPSQTPEQQAAKEALKTGGSYSAALAAQKPHVAASLKPNQNLKDAVAEVLANHDPLADPEDVPPPWVDETKPTREVMRASGPARR